MPRLAYRRGPAGHAETARRPANTTTGPRIRISPKPPNTQDGNMSNKAGSGRYQNGAARRKCKARHIAAEGPIPICPLCGKPIDLTLKTPHPLSCELDEIIPYSRGGSPTSYDNTQLTHRICNQRKSNKIIANTTGHQNTKNNHKTPSQSAANGNRGPYPPPPMQGSPQNTAPASPRNPRGVSYVWPLGCLRAPVEAVPAWF